MLQTLLQKVVIFVLTSATERPKSSMIPDRAGDEYPTYKSIKQPLLINKPIKETFSLSLREVKAGKKLKFQTNRRPKNIGTRHGNQGAEHNHTCG